MKNLDKIMNYHTVLLYFEVNCQCCPILPRSFSVWHLLNSARQENMKVCYQTTLSYSYPKKVELYAMVYDAHLAYTMLIVVFLRNSYTTVAMIYHR